MGEKMNPGPVCGTNGIREAVCVHTKKVYDSCRSKECVRDLRVYLTQPAQEMLNNSAVNVRARDAELLCVCIDVEKIQFNRGFYSVDVRFFYRICVELTCPVGNPQIVDGMGVYDKRVILFGSEGGARIFSSRYVSNRPDIQLQQSSNKPIAVVEVIDPMILEAKIVEPHYHCGCGCELTEVPEGLSPAFTAPLSLGPHSRRLFVTLGQFSIIRLERDIQLLMPAYDICMPERDCSGSDDPSGDDPCDMFERFQFPVDEFFPPRLEPRGNGGGCRCGCENASRGGEGQRPEPPRFDPCGKRC